MAEDPYITGPKSRAERKAEADAAEEAREAEARSKSKRKWYDIVTDAMLPGKFQHGVISEAARKVRDATEK